MDTEDIFPHEILDLFAFRSRPVRADLQHVIAES
jgi:hypothetical protein